LFKPPGARIRFLGERTDLIPALDRLFAALCEDQAISSWSRGLYDAETYQFGGEEGLGAAHSFFTVESLAVLSFWRLAMAGKATIGPSEFSLTLLDLFLRQVVGDEWELWDLWHKMELTGRDLRVAGAARERAIDEAWKRGKPLLDLLRLNDPELTWLPGPERDCLLQYRIKLPSLSARLRQLHSDGALLFPMREILPFWVIFHFNRMCFPADEQRFLSFLMSTVLSPKPSPMRVRAV
jgi:thiopeptide-type bacteriocin biosynthesis protein